MKSIFASTSLLALASAQAGIPTVVVSTTSCSDSSTSPQTFNVVVNMVGVTKFDAKSICGLSLTSSSTLPIGSIICQAFKDAEGREPGSALFSSTNPARISTNPVDVKSIWCRNPEYNGPGANGNGNGTVSASAGGRPTITLGAPITASKTAAEGLVPLQTGGNGNASVSGTGPYGGNGTTFTGGGSGMGGVRMGLGGLVVALGAGVLVL